MDPATRDLLTAIQQTLEPGSPELGELQRFRVASALHTLLAPGSTASLEWASGFIRNPPGEEAS
jgi:hypothetical protein